MRDEKEVTCINCPMGCRLTVTIEDGRPISISGNSCKRGEKYGFQEVTNPVRMVTAVIQVEGSRTPLSVKTAAPIPKGQIRDCMKALSKVRVEAPIFEHDVILENVCGTGVDVIATKSITV